MQKTFLVILAVMFSAAAMTRQQAKVTVKTKAFALPPKIYNVLHDSCTQLDIVFITGRGGSMSLDNAPSVRGFTSFVSMKPVEKIPNATLDGTVMWEINGREYLSGQLFFGGDSSGYIVFNKNDKEYVNALTPDGAGFLKTRGGK
jgi:hypothetical protein